MKGLEQLHGLSRLRTLHSTRQRSIPRRQRSTEIEIFLLQKEKDRFIAEADRIKKRFEAVRARIRNIDEEIYRLKVAQNEKNPTLPELAPQSPADTEWVTKKLTY